MRVLNFYRYVNNVEKLFIMERKTIQSTMNPQGTYYTPDRFENPNDAQRYLSLRSVPENRVGPIFNFAMPVFDVIPLRVVPPAHGQPGGAYEACTSHPLYIFGMYDFDSNQYEM